MEGVPDQIGMKKNAITINSTMTRTTIVINWHLSAEREKQRGGGLVIKEISIYTRAGRSAGSRAQAEVKTVEKLYLHFS